MKNALAVLCWNVPCVLCLAFCYNCVISGHRGAAAIFAVCAVCSFCYPVGKDEPDGR